MKSLIFVMVLGLFFLLVSCSGTSSDSGDSFDQAETTEESSEVTDDNSSSAENSDGEISQTLSSIIIGDASVTYSFNGVADDIALFQVTDEDGKNYSFTCNEDDGTLVVSGLNSETEYGLILSSCNEKGSLINSLFVEVVTLEDGASSISYIPVDTVEKLAAISNDLTGSYIQISNIDLAGLSWGEIGYYVSSDDCEFFTGNFQGGGYTISNLTIDTDEDGFKGLFGYSNGFITNVELIDVNIAATEVTGGLVGVNEGTVTYCSVSGTVTGVNNSLGGLAGFNSGIVSKCSANVDVAGSGNVGGLVGNNYGYVNYSCASGTVSGNNHVGGLVGYTSPSETIEMCYATGSVSGVEFAGGLVGTSGQDSIITNCYATGSVEGDDGAGGLVGFEDRGTVKNCYATGFSSGDDDIGGLIAASTYATVTDCYYDSTTTGYDDAISSWTNEGNATSTANMKLESTYSNWDFSATWSIDSEGSINDGYPYLTELKP